MSQQIPILAFDPAPRAIIEPSRIIEPIDIAPHCVLCFFYDVVAALAQEEGVRQVATLISEMGPNPVYEMEVDGQRLAFVQPGVGAALSGFFFEELIALGCRYFIACGGAGVLDGRLQVGQVVVPTTAVREEGTSYHYLPPEQEATTAPAANAAIAATLQRHHIPYLLGKSWTTDGIYRETAAKMQQRKEEGCLVVEMETAAFCAIAQFRNVTFGQILYGGDNLDGDEWDNRDWVNQPNTREKLFWLAAESCLRLQD